MEIERSDNIREFIGIEYPGRVINVDNMIETLGGHQELSRSFDEKQKLQLKLNPKNLFCKSAISTDQTEVTGMVLKLRVKKVKNDPEKKVEYLSAELVGTVKSMYKFNAFSDYQYLPIYKNEKTGKTENIYHEIVPEDPLQGPLWFRNNKDVPMFFPPVTFCHSDTIQTTMLRNEQKLLSKAENDEIVKFAVTSRINRQKNGIIVQYSNDLRIKVPAKPNEICEDSKYKIVNEEEYKGFVDLFERRPIWTLAALRAHIRNPPKRLSGVLASIAFYYTTGPWRNCFVRFGYDPRKDFKARYYQMLDYRVRQGAGFKVETPNKRPSAIHKRIRAQAVAPVTVVTEESIEENFQMRKREAIFTQDTIPPYRARRYQFIDIHLPNVQQMLENVPGPLTGVVCNEKRGWLPPQFIEDVREILTNIAQANLMKLYKEKNLSLEDVKEESIADSIEQNDDIFDENASDSEESENESIHESMDMEIDDLK